MLMMTHSKTIVHDHLTGQVLLHSTAETVCTSVCAELDANAALLCQLETAGGQTLCRPISCSQALSPGIVSSATFASIATTSGSSQQSTPVVWLVLQTDFTRTCCMVPDDLNDVCSWLWSCSDRAR